MTTSMMTVRICIEAYTSRAIGCVFIGEELGHDAVLLSVRPRNAGFTPCVYFVADKSEVARVIWGDWAPAR